MNTRKSIFRKSWVFSAFFKSLKGRTQGRKTVFNKQKGKRSKFKTHDCHHFGSLENHVLSPDLIFSRSWFLNVDRTLSPGRQRPRPVTCGFYGEKYCQLQQKL